MVGGSGTLYVPSTSANGERKRATCTQEFIKGGCTLQNLDRENPAGVCPSGLSPFIRIKLQDSCVSFVDAGFS